MSHHSMTTFFSHTDENTLKVEGLDTNHFVSLIVNNVGNYTAKMTRKVTKKEVIEEACTYNSFDNIVKEDVTNREVSREELQTFVLNIVKEDPYVDENLDTILKELRAEKAAAAAAKVKVPTGKWDVTARKWIPATTAKLTKVVDKKTSRKLTEQNALANKYAEEYPGMFDFAHESETSMGAPLDLEEEFDYTALPQEEYPQKVFSTIEYSTAEYDKSLVDNIILQLMTGCILIPEDTKIEPAKYAKSMHTLYNKRFPTLDDFDVWAAFYVDYLINYTIEEQAQDDIIDNEQLSALYAYKVSTMLKSFSRNAYINKLIELVEQYII